MDSIKYQQIKNQQVTDSVRNLIMGHVWIFQPYNKTKHKSPKQHKNGSLSTKPSFCWSFHSSDLNPVENECGKRKRRSTVMELWIWRIWSDSGWRKGLWSLVRCSLTSSGIIGEHLELLNWQTEVLNKRVPLIVANMYLRKNFIL